MLSQNPHYASAPRDTLTLDPEFDLRTAAMSVSLALDALTAGDGEATAAYVVVAAQWLGRAHQQLTAVGVAR